MNEMILVKAGVDDTPRAAAVTGDVSAYISQLKEMDEVDRVLNAEELHVSIIDTCSDLAKKWFRLSTLLIPIHELELWQHLYFVDANGIKQYFTSFKEYVNVVVGKPITTVNNSLYAYKALLDTGRDPKELSDISQSRVQSLTKVLKAYDGKPPEEVWQPLVDKARTAKTRDETRSFNEDVATLCAKRGMEVKEWLRVEGDLTQIELIKTCISIQKDSSFYGGNPPTDCTALEHICVQWLQDNHGDMIPEDIEELEAEEATNEAV